jgi:hypothetical protein
MSRGQQTFKQRDVTKALKAAVKAGLPVERVEIDKGGKIIIVTAKVEGAENEDNQERNEWDEALQ